MKEIYVRHKKGILIFTFLLTLLMFFTLISDRKSNLSTSIGTTVISSIMFFLTGYMGAAIFDLLRWILQKLIKKEKIENTTQKQISDSKDIPESTASPKQLHVEKQLDIALQQPIISIDNTLRCKSCNQITTQLSRVKFKDGYLCGECLTKLGLFKSIDLDLWAKQHSWQAAEHYITEKRHN